MDEDQFPWAKKWSDITDENVRRAFSRVDRAWFLNQTTQKLADRDAPLPIGEGQTISQPYVVALMLQAMNIQVGDRLLEVGAGSGYQTALLCELTDDGVARNDQLVYAVERSEVLAERAQRRLEQHGYTPHIVTGDGALGWIDSAPYQAIVVSAAAKCVPKALWDQLDEQGRLVIPVGGRHAMQTLWRLVKQGERVETNNMGPVRFVPLVSPSLKNPDSCLDGV